MAQIMNYEMKEINKTLLVSWLSIIGILIFTYSIQVYKHERSLGYLIVFSLIMIIPWLAVYFIYKRKEDWNNLGYVIVLGYSIMYAFVLFTGATLMVSNYILPLLSFLILYHRPVLVLYTFVITAIINVASFIHDLNQGEISSLNMKDVEIKFATIIICFAGSYVCAKLYDRISEERVKTTRAAIKAEAANEAKGEFLAHMSHEIRTPINAVLGMDTMILRESKEPHIKEYAMDIQRAGRNLLSIINDILDFSKIESGKMEIIPVDYDFSSLIYDTVNMIHEKAKEKGLELFVEVDNDIPYMLHGDDVRIRQILINLLSNAVKYTEKGSVTFKVNGTMVDSIEKLTFTIKDTGIGIKKEDLSKLFSEFERVEEERNRHIEGTGLGMSITKNLLNMMNSALIVNSEYGVGTEFSFEVEQGIVSLEPVGNLASRIDLENKEYEYDVPFTAPEAKVLVVDDNSTNLLVFSNLLKETEINVHTASSGIEALETIKNNKYDIIFLDHMMPDMDGIEVMQKITSSTDHLNVGTPVIVLTANAIVGAKEKYISAGFTDYLSKPIIPDKLEKTIQQYLPNEKIIFGKKDTSKRKITIEYQEKLPQIEGVNWEYARLHLNNSDAILTTVNTVYNAINYDADEIERYYESIVSDNTNEEAINSYRIKIHSIKSTTTLLGMLPIAGMAATLEYAARDGKIDKVLEMTPYFLSDFKEYKNKFKCLIESDSESEKEEIKDKNEVIEKVNELIEQIAMFDVHEADLTLEKIKSYKYNDDVDVLIDKLSGAVSNLDTDSVEVLGKELIEEINKL